MCIGYWKHPVYAMCYFLDSNQKEKTKKRRKNEKEKKERKNQRKKEEEKEKKEGEKEKKENIFLFLKNNIFLFF